MEMQKQANNSTQSSVLVWYPKYLTKRMLGVTLSTGVLLAALLWNQTLWAADKMANINEDPAIQRAAAAFIQQLADKALTNLNQKGSSLTDQEGRFREILAEGFDVNYIGRISLGRHRKKASSQHLQNYYSLFPEYLVKVYTSRLTKLNTREVRVRQVLPNGKRDMYVRTKVIDAEKKSYDVDWRVRPDKTTVETAVDEDQGYRIIDVKIEGISMARTQRDDFAARIQESGIIGLLDFMQAIIDNTAIGQEDTKEKTE